MLIVAADLGSYSVKFIVSKVDRKKIVHHTISEEVIDYDSLEDQNENPLWEKQFEIIKEFISKLPEGYKLIINAPGHLFTDRFTSVPITNRKKATLMIPFSLEEELPFALSETHIGMTLTSLKKSTEALVNITKKQDFDPYYQIMLRNKIHPKVVTTEVSLFDYFVKDTKIPFGNSFCILDIGHNSTKAYFFNNRKLVSTHKSFIAGKTITESIAKNYNNDLAQAHLYKHQSCFFLTESQLDQFNEDQRSFANLMHQTFLPLVNEIKRWELGYRISNGVTVSEIFITGGTSNIKNITNYLEEQLSSQVSHLDSFQGTEIDQIDQDEKQLRKFSVANLEVLSYPNKSKLINLLSGEYLIPGEMDLPLHSFFYISTRLATITILIIVSFVINGFFIGSQIESSNKILDGLSKNQTLELTNKQSRQIKTPQIIELRKIHRSLKSKTNMINQEVKSLQSALEINAVFPLLKLKDSITSSDFEILDFNGSSLGEFSAIIKGKNLEKLKELEIKLSSSNFNDLFIDLNEKALTITINATL